MWYTRYFLLFWHNMWHMVHFNKYFLQEVNETQATSFLRREDKLMGFRFWEPKRELSFLSQYTRDFHSWNLEQTQLSYYSSSATRRSWWPLHCDEIVFVSCWFILWNGEDFLWRSVGKKGKKWRWVLRQKLLVAQNLERYTPGEFYAW